MGKAKRHGLTIIVAQHQLCHLGRHRPEHLVALVQRHQPAPHLLIEEDLYVYLVVRAIHPAGIIDKVSVGRPAGAGEFYAAKLGEAQITAFSKHPAV